MNCTWCCRNPGIGSVPWAATTGSPSGGFRKFDDLLDSTSLEHADKALIVSRIGEQEKAKLLGGITRKEFESLAKGFMLESPGSPSVDKLRQLQLEVQRALAPIGGVFVVG